jgi:hypothetical protein
MLGDVRLADVQRLFEVAHALYAMNQVFEDFDTDWMGNDFQDFDSLLRGDHLIITSLNGGNGLIYIQTLLYFYAFVNRKFSGFSSTATGRIR